LKPAFEAEGMLLMDYSDIRLIGANDFETTDGFHGSEVSYLRLLKLLVAEDKILRRHANTARIDQLITHAYSARQILEELTEAVPRRPRGIQ
jgi:hypothetical protein